MAAGPRGPPGQLAVQSAAVAGRRGAGAALTPPL
ncbi:hypothetical protein SRHO_G00191560 [Serrasalmus rhombeus]